MSLMKWPSVAAFRRVAVAAMVCASLMAGAAPARRRRSRRPLRPVAAHPAAPPGAEVIIGNPSIADVTIQGGNLLVVTGKTFGVTNIIALDAQRNVIQDQRVVVEQDPRHSRGSL